MEDFPYLRKIGVESLEDISKTLLSISKGLRTEVLTNGLILELSDITQTLEKGKTSVSSDKITKRQLCEFILQVACNRSSESITPQEIRKYTDYRIFVSLRDSVKKGKMSETDIWSKVYKFQSKEVTSDSSQQLSDPDTLVGQLPRVPSPLEESNQQTSGKLLYSTMEILSHESTSKEETSVKPEVKNLCDIEDNISTNSHLKNAGLFDSMCLQDQLFEWNPSISDITNGLILELEACSSKFKWKIVTNKICNLAGIHRDKWDSQCDRVRNLIRRTKDIHNIEQILDQPWYYLEKLSPGGTLFNESLSMSNNKQLIDEIGAKVTEDIVNLKFYYCWYCCSSGEDVQLKVCKGCMVAVYCSKECLNNDWKIDHK